MDYSLLGPSVHGILQARILEWAATSFSRTSSRPRDQTQVSNLYAGQEATVRTGQGTTDWFQIEKGVHQGCILSPCLLNLYAEYIIRNTGLEEAQAGIKIAREISITSDMQMTPPLWQKVKRNSKAS